MSGSKDVPGSNMSSVADHRSSRFGAPLRDLGAGAWRRHPLIEDADRTQAGLLNGALWLGATVTLLPVLFVGSVPSSHRALLWVLAAFGLLMGLASFTVIDWRHVPSWLFLSISLVAVALLGTVIWGTGGVHSPVSSYLTISILFTAWFYPARVALGFLLINVLVNVAPVIYDHDTGSVNEWLRFLFSSSVFALVAGGILIGRALTWLHRERADRLAVRHRAMRTIASAVVEGVDAESMYRIVAREVLALSDGGWAGVLRVNGGETLTLMGAWPPDTEGVDPTGTTIALMPDSPIRVVLRTKLPARLEDLSTTRFGEHAGFTSGLVAPVLTQDNNPFVITVTSALGRELRDDREELVVVGEAVATAIKSLHDRDKLAEQASSDSLTGVANHRVLTATLASEVRAAVESDGSLSVAVMDIDEFKQINDSAGHEFGDATLIRLAHSMREVAGRQDTISRVGGDEFVWVMPGIAAEEAFERVECARELFQRAPGDHMVTISVGICDLTSAREPADLTRLADGALYWCKAHGRARTRIYDPAAVDDLSESERAERLAQAQTLVGLRALARAIDAKDPVTSQHSERVADLAARLARANGWPEARISLLRDAALVHDVGKLAIPDALLTKSGALSERERLQMSQHVELSVRIATGVLTDEQLDWIATHHERPDGSGYPRGLRGDQIPDGGGLISIANAFDAMTVGHRYGRELSPPEALEECRAHAGTQFQARAVAGLAQIIVEARAGRAISAHQQAL